MKIHLVLDFNMVCLLLTLVSQVYNNSGKTLQSDSGMFRLREAAPLLGLLVMGLYLSHEIVDLEGPLSAISGSSL